MVHLDSLALKDCVESASLEISFFQRCQRSSPHACIQAAIHREPIFLHHCASVNQPMAFGKLSHACVLRQQSVPVPWSDFCSIACEFVRHVDAQDSCCLKLYTETF